MMLLLGLLFVVLAAAMLFLAVALTVVNPLGGLIGLVLFFVIARAVWRRGRRWFASSRSPDARRHHRARVAAAAARVEAAHAEALRRLGDASD
ncbi:MAG: hypothetical protein JO054_18870 [Actinobacteria bacterium]|nr:hypothetical protein [Actinomycetota bacterium]